MPEMVAGELVVIPGPGGRGGEPGFTFLALASSGPASSAQALTGMQVLVVAADPTERRVLGMQTELWGAPSIGAEPAEALAMITAGRTFDVALIEHRKPVIDGLAVAAAIRTQRSHADLPIVLVLSGAVGVDEVTAADSGVVQATLPKPVTPQKLPDVLAQVR